MNEISHKITPSDLDHFWATCPIYTERKKLKTYVLNKRHKRESINASETWEVVRIFLSDRDEAVKAYRCYCEDGGELSLLKQRDKIFLTDCGHTLRTLRERFELDKAAVAALILRLDEDEECCLIGDELCVEIESHEQYFSAYIEMIVLISKIKKLGGFWSYVWNYDEKKEGSTGEREIGC